MRELLLDAVHQDDRIDDDLVLAYEERVVACLGSAARLSGDGWATPEPPRELPTTGIYGWHDRWVSVSNTTGGCGFGKADAGERHFFMLKNSGHLPQLEQPGDLADILGALSGKGNIAALEPCLGEGVIYPADHPRSGHVRRRAFDGEFPVSCVGEGPTPVPQMDCGQLEAACFERNEPACARLIELQAADQCRTRACEPIRELYDQACMDEVSGEVCYKMGMAVLYGLCPRNEVGHSDMMLFFEEGCLQGHQPSCEMEKSADPIYQERNPPFEHKGGLL